MGVAAAVITAVSAIESQRQQRKARKEDEEAREIQGKRDELANARQRRRALVESRRARASAVSEGVSAGVSGSSAVAGAAGSVQTQGATNVSFLNQIESLNVARLGHLNKAASATGKAATATAVGSLPGQLGFKADVTSFFNPET